MRNIVLCFNLVAVIFAIITALTLFMAIVSTNEAGPFSINKIWLISMAFMALLAVNLTIANGLKQYRRWAYLLAIIEATVFVVLSVSGLIYTNFDKWVGSLFVIIVSSFLMLALKRDFTANISHGAHIK